MRRKIISTSTSSLYDLHINHNIELIRLRLYINNVEFTDGININAKRLRNLMSNLDSSAVHTAPAPRQEVIDLFNKLYNQGYEEVFITTLSSKMSQSHDIIKNAAAEFQDKMDIYVYDCKELNVCESILALEAAQLSTHEYSMPKIARRLDELRQQHKMLFTVNDLSYLIKNKKLSSTAGFFANIFNIKPILEVTDDGQIVTVQKIRTLDKSLDYIIKGFANCLQNNCFLYALSAGQTELDNYFISRLKKQTKLNNIPILPVSAISLANHGPSGVGLCAFTKEIPHAAQYYR
ncbi:DegV family protein [Psychrobacter sp. I-STPA10]|uniref:DegV family protein n=1 Tax=Psychrobacter sp. I-STPA10 TaxID=2585769 RepID=UPI001E59C99A|nr:DegV family protein [Psychrobacter sp. I-STPA10]